MQSEHLVRMTTSELGDYLADLERTVPPNAWTHDRIRVVRAILAERAGLIAADHPQLWRADDLVNAAIVARVRADSVRTRHNH